MESLKIPVDKLIDLDINVVNGNLIPFNNHYLLVGNDSYYRLKTFLHYLDADFNLLEKRHFLTRLYQDHRIIFFEGKYHVWCNYFDGKSMQYGILNTSSNSLEIAKIESENFTQNEKEKNWCPFLKNGQFHAVYSLFPEFVILKMTEKGMYEKIYSEKSVFLKNWVKENVDLQLVKHLGGGTNFIKYEDVFIGTFHVKYHDLKYESYLLVFTTDFLIKNIAQIDYGESLYQGKTLRKLKSELELDESTFIVGEYRKILNQVAFTTGIFFQGDKFYISFGVNDLATKVAVIGKKKVDDFIS